MHIRKSLIFDFHSYISLFPFSTLLVFPVCRLSWSVCVLSRAHFLRFAEQIEAENISFRRALAGKMLEPRRKCRAASKHRRRQGAARDNGELEIPPQERVKINRKGRIYNFEIYPLVRSTARTHVHSFSSRLPLVCFVFLLPIISCSTFPFARLNHSQNVPQESRLRTSQDSSFS